MHFRDRAGWPGWRHGAASPFWGGAPGGAPDYIAHMLHDRESFAPGGAPAERPLVPALRRGWRRRCPNCGGGQVFSGYLNVRSTCAACGEELSHHRADDLPAWITIVVVGHLVGALLLSVETAFTPPMWLHFAVWPTLALGLTLWLLPRVKGAVVAMQWAWRMHGFGDEHG